MKKTSHKYTHKNIIFSTFFGLFLNCTSLYAMNLANHDTNEDFLNKEATIEHAYDHLGMTGFDFIDPTINTNDDRSNLYNYRIAKAPQFHPYNNFLYGNPVFMHLPAGKVAIPEAIKMYLLSRIPNLSLDHTDFFMVVQANTMTPGTPLLYRPQYYTDQNIPEGGMAPHECNMVWNTSVGFFNLLPQETTSVNQQIFPKFSPVSLINSAGERVNEAWGVSSTHTAGANDLQLILSPPLEGGAIGLDGLTDNRETSAFWTTTILYPCGQTNIEKIAITLHILLGATPYDFNEASPLSKMYDFLTSEKSITALDVATYLDNTYFGYTFHGQKFKNQGYISSLLNKNDYFSVLPIPVFFDPEIYISMYGELSVPLDASGADAAKRAEQARIHFATHQNGYAGIIQPNNSSIPEDFDPEAYIEIRPWLKQIVNSSGANAEERAIQARLHFMTHSNGYARYLSEEFPYK